MAALTSRTCPAIDTIAAEQSTFWQDFQSGHLSKHEIGWLIAGCASIITVILSLTTATMHALNYSKPAHQRQIMRIVLMPAVYAVISFFSYRFFRTYTYYSLAQVVYEALAIAAFLYLLLYYIGSSTEEQKQVLQAKDKTKLIFPLCCWRFRPSKPYFLITLKWSVLQYSFLRPLISIIGIICQATGVLCPTQYSVYFAAVYLEAVDFVSISVALYGLILFYALVRQRLNGHRPLAKFLTIKAIVFFTFYQNFVFNALQAHGVIKATQYWTAANVADGLSALCTTCEMVIFAAVMMWSFPWSEYRSAKKTNPLRAYWDCINYWDFIVEFARGFKFFFDFGRGKQGTHSKHFKSGFSVEDAFLGEDHGQHFNRDQEKAAPSSWTDSLAMQEKASNGRSLPNGARHSMDYSQPSQSAIPYNRPLDHSLPDQYSNTSNTHLIAPNSNQYTYYHAGQDSNPTSQRNSAAGYAV